MKEQYTAIIPAFNAEDTILELVYSLMRLKKPPSEIIVIDDASTDQTNKLLQSIEEVKLLRLQKNSGPGFARNLGAQNAKTKWLLFIDSDCELPSSSIENAFPTVEEEKNSIVGIMGVFDIKEENNNSILGYKNMQRHFEIKAMKNPPEVFSSSCFTIRKKSFLECGGFNDSYGKTPTEDNEFYFRLLKKNLFIKYNTDFCFFHHKKMSLKTLIYDDFKRTRAIIYNLFGKLGEKRNKISRKELIKWLIELASGFCITIILISLPIFILILPRIYINIILPSLIIFGCNMTLINYKFLKYSQNKGGIKMLIKHLLLRIFEMVIATTGILITFIELILLYLSNNKETKLNDW